jgi:hypothetical protein
MFNEGGKIMFRTTLAYLKTHENNILNLTHMGELLHYFNQAPMKEFDHQSLVKACFSFYNLKRGYLDSCRIKCTILVEDEIKELEQRRVAAKQRLMEIRKQYQQQHEVVAELATQVVQPITAGNEDDLVQ